MEEKARLEELILQWRADRNAAQKRWSGVHHIALFGSIFCSVFAGAQIQVFENTGFATILTSIAAVLTGLASSGGFERKWRSNRLSRGKADCLLIDLDTADADLKKIRKQFKSAIEKHDLEIIGDAKEEE